MTMTDILTEITSIAAFKLYTYTDEDLSKQNPLPENVLTYDWKDNTYSLLTHEKDIEKTLPWALERIKTGDLKEGTYAGDKV